MQPVAYDIDHDQLWRRGLREAKYLYKARVLVPTTSAGRHQLGKETRVADVQFVGRDSHDVTIFGVHIADAPGVLATAEEVMVGFEPGGRGCQGRVREFGKWMQSESVVLEEEDTEEDEDNAGCQ